MSNRDYGKSCKPAKKMADGGSVKEKVLGLFGIKKPEGYKSASEEKAEAEAAASAKRKANSTDASIGGAISAIQARKKQLDDI